MAITDGARFTIPDYIVFGAMLCVSALIGVYYACTGGRQRTEKEWLAGNQNLAWIPTALSLLASFISAITLLGTPSEIYTAGVMYLWLAISYFFTSPVCAFVYMPVFRRVNSISAFTYIRKRFAHPLAVFGCVMYSIQMIFYMGIVLYSPALALSAVTGLSLEGCIIAVSVVCIFYTVIGGMKAIIWTDAFQTCVMVVGMMIISIAGTWRVGGFGTLMDVAKTGLRFEWTKFSLDPRVRHSGTDTLIGSIFTWVSVYGANQAQIQRYVSMATKRDAQKAIFSNLPGLIFLMYISGYCGLVAYTKYALCDPISNNQIDRADQILPYFVTDCFNDWPGFAGLFVSSIFSGSMSTISSGVNAIAAVVLSDILPQDFLSTESRATVGKFLAIFFGAASVGFAFACQYLQSILQLALSIFAILGTPLLGIFTLGMLTKRANTFGATMGYMISLGLQLMIYFGSQAKTYSPGKLILYNTNCTFGLSSSQITSQLIQNQEEFGAFSTPTDTSGWPLLDYTLFRVSYMWYGLIGLTTCVTTGYIFSLLYNLKYETRDPDLDLLFHWEDVTHSEDYMVPAYDLRKCGSVPDETFVLEDSKLSK